jgi:hypothetical protein
MITQDDCANLSEEIVKLIFSAPSVPDLKAQISQLLCRTLEDAEVLTIIE